MQTTKYLETVGPFECVTERPDCGWFGESTEKRTPFIRIPLRVTEGPCAGQRITWTGWLSEAAFDNTIARLTEVFGFDGDLAALHHGKTSLAGLPCNITTESEEYKGKTRVRVAWLNAPGGKAAPVPMDEMKVQCLINQLSARGKAVAQNMKSVMTATGKQVPTPTQVEIPTTAPKDDDVPF